MTGSGLSIDSRSTITRTGREVLDDAAVAEDARIDPVLERDNLDANDWREGDGGGYWMNEDADERDEIVDGAS